MTIRAIIGTIAVLAGFAVVERSVDARMGHAAPCGAMSAHAMPSADAAGLETTTGTPNARAEGCRD